MNIYDVAKLAGVSIATVSRVINNSPSVSEKTAERVKEVMREGGYVPNAFARGLGLNTMRMVGVLCTDLSDPFYAASVGRVQALLRENGKDTVLACTGNSLQNKKKCLSDIVRRKVDAVVLIGSAFKEDKDNSHIVEAAKKVPVVIINGWIDLENVYCVVCAEREATRSLTRQLIASGCRAPLFLHGASTYSGGEKLGGFTEGCGEVRGTVLRLSRDVESASEAIRAQYAESPFDCVVGSEDTLAAAALKALEKLGLKMPVTGFNNSSLCLCTTPTLTSVDNVPESMCRCAVRLLGELDEGGNPPARTVLSARLVRRESY
ncbi:MAG: LacI family DNA-binding transcriptional regulator [Clostridia bacterium]|nr:LacI family DNA-binding transcriptional regulator [Clostridia bacterium]